MSLLRILLYVIVCITISLINSYKNITDKLNMKEKKELPKNERCAYIDCCYLADALDCYGYKIDCILFLKSNGRFFTRRAFDNAVDELIDKTRARHEMLTP